MQKKLLFLSIVINLVLLLAFGILIRSLGGWRYVLHKAQHRGLGGTYVHKREMYEQLPVPQGSTVFLGNSITEQCNWSELLGQPDIINRGISGDITAGLLERLTPITQGQPARIFLMIGVNDLISQRPAAVVSNYRQIIQTIRQQAPATELILQSVLPVNNEVRKTGIQNADILQLNTQIQELAEEFQLTYIDLHTIMQDEQGRLDAQLTSDGVHLNIKAYQRWKGAIFEPYFEQ
ncbi:MAG: GDSL-type esterase/lipase family protein [Bacteroidota bacterium]